MAKIGNQVEVRNRLTVLSRIIKPAVNQIAHTQSKLTRSTIWIQVTKNLVGVPEIAQEPRKISGSPSDTLLIVIETKSVVVTVLIEVLLLAHKNPPI
jgi:hypothetical protein